MRGNRRNNKKYNSAASGTGSNSNPFNYGNSTNDRDVEDDDDDGTPPLLLKILGPLAPIVLSQDYRDAEKLQDRLRLYSLSVLGISVFFWLWALYNTLHLRSNGGFDLGVFSFFGSGISSALLLRSSLGGKCYDRNQKFGCCGKKEKVDADIDDDVDMYGIRRTNKRRDDAPVHSPPGKFLRAIVALTQIIVVANYGLGILFAFTAGGTKVYVYFATYCVIFSILWLVVAFAGWVLIGFYREAVRRTYGEEVLNGPPRPSCWRRFLISLTNQYRGYGTAGMNDYYEDDEDDIDDELRALYEGRGGYTNA